MNNEKETDWKNYYVTIILVIINVIAYILCVQMGEVVYNVGSMNAEKVFVNHQYYRLFTAMFLHADLEHIFSNMIFLAGLGEMIEGSIGHLRYGILYLVSGLGASIASMVHSVMIGNIYDSVGASGAIFGLIGGLLILVIINNGRFGAVSIRRLIFAVAYMIYSGARTQHVDNAAHIGGLICGVLIMAAINVIDSHRYTSEY